MINRIICRITKHTKDLDCHECDEEGVQELLSADNADAPNHAEQ